MAKADAKTTFYILCTIISLATVVGIGYGLFQTEKNTRVSEAAPNAANGHIITDEEIIDCLGAGEAEMEIYALRLGQSEHARKRSFYSESDKNDTVHISFSFWLLKTADRLVVVDTGFADPRKIASWNIKEPRTAGEALEELGISADLVGDVVLTHKHWDHVEGVASFPRAKIWADRKEWMSLRKSCTQYKPHFCGELEQIVNESRLRFTKSLHRLLPGVCIVKEGAHTRHFQYLVVRNKEGLWVLSSDEGPLYANYERLVASGQSGNQTESRRVLSRLLRLTDSEIFRLVPGHDPELFTRFREIKPGIVRLSRSTLNRTQ